MNINDIGKQILKIAIQSLLIAAVAFLVIVFAGGKARETSRVLIEKRSSFVVWENRGERLITLQNDYKKIQNDASRIAALLPTEDELINFFSTLDDIARATGNQQSFNFSGGVNPATDFEPKNINFTMTLQGTSDNFSAYLKKLNSIPYYVKIINFNISGAQGINSQAAVNLSGRIYIR